MTRSGRPSPSMSPIAVAIGPSPGVRLCAGANAEESRRRVGKVGLKGAGAAALNPLTVTMSGIKVAPAGAIAVKESLLAADIAADIPPKWTIFSAATVLKFLPLMVTRVPAGPVLGAMLVTTGTRVICNCASVLVTVATELLTVTE